MAKWILLGLFVLLILLLSFFYQPNNILNNDHLLAQQPIESSISPISFSDDMPLSNSQNQAVTNLEPELPVFIITCENIIVSDENKQLHQRYFNRFLQSDDVNHQLIFALYDDTADATEQLNRLVSVQNNFPANHIANFELINACVTLKNDSRCNDRLIKQGAMIDSGNAALWLNVASYHLEREQIILAKQALTDLTFATHYQSYIDEQNTIYLELMKSSPVQSVAFHFPKTFSVAAAKQFHFNKILNFCRDSFETDQSAKQLCLEVGRTMEDIGDDQFIKQMGRLLQKEVHAFESNMNLVAELDSQLGFNDVNHEHYFNSLMLLPHDKALYLEWIEQKKLNGENKAAKWLVNTAIKKSSNPYYQPCH